MDKYEVLKKIKKFLDENSSVRISGCGKEITISEYERFNYSAVDTDGVSWDFNVEQLDTFIKSTIDDFTEKNCDLEIKIF